MAEAQRCAGQRVARCPLEPNTVDAEDMEYPEVTEVQLCVPILHIWRVFEHELCYGLGAKIVLEGVY